MLDKFQSNELNKINSGSNRALFLVGTGISILVLTIAILYSSLAAAGEVEIEQNQLVMNKEKESYNTKVDIKHSAMTSETKKSTSARDSRIGAFSMEDGAMEGFYGDGEYAD